MYISKVQIFLEQREVGFLSPSKICENLNFSTWHLLKFKFSQILLGDKNATYLCSKAISTLLIVLKHYLCRGKLNKIENKNLNYIYLNIAN